MSFPDGFQVTATLGLTQYRHDARTLAEALGEKARLELRGFTVTEPVPVFGRDNVVALRRDEPKGDVA